MVTHRVTVNHPRQWRFARTKATLLVILAGMFACTIIGIPVAAMIWSYVMFRYGAHQLWKEQQH